MTKPFRAAIIGTGNIAGAHMRAFLQEEHRVEVVAAVEVDAGRLEEFSAAHGIAHQYQDAQAMFNEQQPNLVMICTPPFTHIELCILALNSGAHAVCEKPLVASLDELDRIQGAEKETGLTCSSIFQWRFGSGAQHLKQLIDKNELGRPLVGICNTTWYRTHAYYEVPWRGKWDTELGGVSMGHGIHAMDMFLWLMGDWAEVSATMGTLDRKIEVEDVSMAHVHFSNGAMGSIVNSVLSPREVSYVRFDFQRATVELEHLYSHSNNHWRFSVPDGAGYEDDLKRWQALPDNVQSSHGAQLKHTLDALEAGQQPLTSGNQARSTLEFLTALYKSGITKQRVKRGSITPEDPFYRHIYGAEKPMGLS